MSERNSRRDFMGATGATAGLAALAAALGGNAAHGAESIELNAMQPTPEQLQAFMKLPQDRPIIMVNLLKFKDPVEYQKYGVGVAKIFKEIGAEILFSGECKMALIGGAQWDSVALAKYPNAQALVKMAQMPEYQKIHVHREAGLEGQINLAVFETGALTGDGTDDSGGVTADQLMSQMDANGDGKISMDEAPDQLKGAFDVVDANGDGGIDVQEAQTIVDFLNNQ